MIIAGATVRRLGALAVLACAVAFAVGFRAFAERVAQPHVALHSAADAIVVLTGGRARLAEAGRLAREGWGRRLLISGVNPRTSPEDLIRLTGIAEAEFRCCVDVGYSALDTIGNADETGLWARSHNFRRLIVVTAAYHMPRSLAELAHALPGVELTPHPVMPQAADLTQWGAGAASLRVLLGEYVKFLMATARLALARLLVGGDAAVATANSSPREPASSPPHIMAHRK